MARFRNLARAQERTAINELGKTIKQMSSCLYIMSLECELTSSEVINLADHALVCLAAPMFSESRAA